MSAQAEDSEQKSAPSQDLLLDSLSACEAPKKRRKKATKARHRKVQMSQEGSKRKRH